jgi:hypothetical protein
MRSASTTSRTEMETPVQPEIENPRDHRSRHEVQPGSTVPNPRAESPPNVSEIGPAPSRRSGRKVITGGYYWLPAPHAGGIIWTVVNCRDLGCGADAGHDTDLWPKLIDRLAATWGRDGKTLRRRLDLHYTGLPRGRVTRPGKVYLILHGNDSPIPGWQVLVSESFGLAGRPVKIIFDEHETMIPGHPRAVELALGLRFHGAKS